MIRATIIVVVAVIVAFVVAWRVDAHTLTLAGAERVSDRTADSISPARVELCRRTSRHVVYCRAVFERTPEGRRCTTVIRVRFPGRTRDASAKIISIGCD